MASNGQTSKPASKENDDLDAFFKTTITQLNRTTEVERILSLPKIDPFSILELETSCDDNDIKKAYRNKSRLVHPDKTQHPKAVDAFDVLKQAQDQLLDEDNRRFLLKMIADAESILKKELADSLKKGGLAHSSTQAAKQSSSLKLQQQQPLLPSKHQVMAKFRALIVELEWQRIRKAAAETDRKAAELAAKEKAKQAAEESQKRERDWDQARDERVSSWRQFQNKSLSSKKSGKKKIKK
ncbi:J domain-containing protein spf31 [Smittium culicis]|uniref:J domain-containing protein spf31 n=1 Tax=Smittium culicis TaxID=133412 RepID=A0A1R1X4I8_9FUNG|nr:J domain-containing protein spf31 [Smittium culicis]OMJ09558.1 J domain-containing protein spf31 [Smittium culicis]